MTIGQKVLGYKILLFVYFTMLRQLANSQLTEWQSVKKIMAKNAGPCLIKFYNVTIYEAATSA